MKFQRIKVLLIVLLCASMILPYKVTAQHAFTPISKSTYDYAQDFLDRYYDKDNYALVNFMLSYSLMYEPFKALSVRMNISRNNGIITVRNKDKEYRMECSPELYSSLLLLTKHVVNTASFINDGIGLDGATYYLFLRGKGVTAWSPEGLPGHAVKLFEHIGTSVMAGDRERVESFTPVADYLYHQFRKKYHEDMLKTGVGVSMTWPPGSVYTLSLGADMGSDMFMPYDQGGFVLKFKFDEDSFREEYRKLYLDKYDSLLRKLGYWVYVQSDFADDSNYATFIVDDSVATPVVREEGPCQFEIRIPESALDADRMISLLEGLHKEKLINFIIDNKVVIPAGSTSITPQEVEARLDESITDVLMIPVPKSMKERLGYEQHPDQEAAVDLGLSVKWAPFNIGAEKAEDNGDYFAWGEVETKSSYDVHNYMFESADDAAHVRWGGSWRMPTQDEWEELRSGCIWTWTTLNGVKGFRVSGNRPGYTDRYIFLPAAGLCDGEFFFNAHYDDDAHRGWYWSSTLDSSYADYAKCLMFGPKYIRVDGGARMVGASVRPVVPVTPAVATEPVMEKVEIDDVCYYIYPESKTAYVTSGDVYVGDVVIPSKIKYKRKTYRVTGIAASAFKEEYFITSVSIPESVTFIGDSAFYKCKALTEVNIPSGVTGIAPGTFMDCESLESIDIPKSITAIDLSAFDGCHALHFKGNTVQTK